MQVKQLQLLLSLLFTVAVTFNVNAQADAPVSDLCYALVEDISADDTGELRIRLASDSAAGEACADVNLPANVGKDGFFTLTGGSTSNANVIVQIRIKDNGTLEFRNGPYVDAVTGAPITLPAYAVGTWTNICYAWVNDGTNTVVTLTIDGVVVGTFNSGGAPGPQDARNLQFSYGDNSGVQAAGEGLAVDNVVVTGDVAYDENFDAFIDADVLDDTVGFHGNSSDASAACVEIPTAGQWGLMILALSLCSIGLIAVREEEAVFAC